MIGQSRLTSIGVTVITASSKKENKMSYFVREEKNVWFSYLFNKWSPKDSVCRTLMGFPLCTNSNHYLWRLSQEIAGLVSLEISFTAWQSRAPSLACNYCTLVFIWFSLLKVSLEVISFYCRMTMSQTMKRDCLWENPDLLWLKADISFF